ncbi:MAG: ABC transporter substrate-binding protein, partial [Vulcanimicrobiaceae bacterium]
NMSFMAHPEGLQALLSGQVVAVYSSPPFQQIALSKGAHVIIEGDQLFPHASFVMSYINTNFAAQYPEFTQTLFHLISDATKFIQTNRDATAEFLSKDSGKIAAGVFKEELADKAVVFNPTPRGVLGYAQFMHQIGLIEKVPKSVRELEYSGIGGIGD